MRPTEKTTDGFRPDIQGLRAIAVGAVVLCHLGIGPFPGGYVGVDVFFAISGFLITGLMLREVDRTGRLSLAGFYARRARRILPAASVVLLATAVGLGLAGIGGPPPAVVAIGITAVASVPAAAIAYQTINFHHYIVDAVIWRSRKPKGAVSRPTPA